MYPIVTLNFLISFENPDNTGINRLSSARIIAVLPDLEILWYSDIFCPTYLDWEISSGKPTISIFLEDEKVSQKNLYLFLL